MLREKGVRSLLGVPLLIEGRVLGVLHVGSLAPRRFTPEERDLLQLAADRAALAIENALLFEQRRVAEALQRQLLPQDLDARRRVELASRYLPASGESLGGDWYDSFPLTGGRIAVVVGDVVGHGLNAAAVMAQLRTAVRAYAADGHDPAAVAERVNRLMWSLGPIAMTTLAYVVLDPEQESLDLVNAGHPPPLVIDPGGDASFLPLQGSAALGTSATARYACTHPPVPHGLGAGALHGRARRAPRRAARRRPRAPAGRGRGRRRARGAVRARDRPARARPARRTTSRSSPCACRARRSACARAGPPTSGSLAGVRGLLRRWLRDRGANRDEVYDITVACQEACANAVEHAYRPGRASFALEAELDAGLVRLTVSDSGRWRPPRGTNRGRGLLLMEALMDAVDVRHGESGTVVVLERRLGAR